MKLRFLFLPALLSPDDGIHDVSPETEMHSFSESDVSINTQSRLNCISLTVSSLNLGLFSHPSLNSMNASGRRIE